MAYPGDDVRAAMRDNWAISARHMMSSKKGDCRKNLLLRSMSPRIGVAREEFSLALLAG